MTEKISFKIKGIHCRGCKVLIEEEVKRNKGVEKIEVDYIKERAVLVLKDLGQKKMIFETIKKLGYEASEDIYGEEKSLKNKGDKARRETKKSLFYFFIFLFIFLLGFFLIRNLEAFELLAKLNENNIGYFLIFIIGLLASFHCIGMCGGLVVSYTVADIQKQKKAKLKKHLSYNVGRIISYTSIGAVLGGFGSFFGINPNFSGVILLLAGFFMLLMGVSIFSGFSFVQKIKAKFFSLVKIKKLGSFSNFIAKYLHKNKRNKKPKGPFIIGLLTGFMPCGPLQAIQLYALASGSILQGSLSMLFFSLGTVPLMFGFGAIIGMLSASKIAKIIKISGVVLIALSLLMINRGLTNFGVGFNGLFYQGPKINIEEKNENEIFQTVEMDVGYNGYQPNVIYVQKDVPVRWIIRDRGITGCTNEIFLHHEDGIIKKKLNKKETIIEFTPTVLGELKFSCWMRMVWGKFIVTEKKDKSSVLKIPAASASQAKPENISCGGTCGGSCRQKNTTKTCACGVK